MANFIFNSANSQISLNTLDLSTGNYYAHLVVSVPVIGSSSVANLDLVSVPGYTSRLLTGLSLNASRWTFDSFDFPLNAFNPAPVGVVICKMSGATPSSTDLVICYSDFVNSISQIVLFTAGSYVVNLQFSSLGAINFSYRYQYSSGAYFNNETFPKGLIYLIGSNNNTLSFSAPTSKILQRFSGVVGTISLINRVSDGTFSAAGGTKLYGLDFQSLLVKPGTLRLFSAPPSAGTPFANYTIFASNNANINAVNWTDLSLYTQLGVPTGVTSSFEISIPLNSLTFWRFFLIQVVTGNTTTYTLEAEFYNSSALSPTINFV
jgi:hypothetical protein